MQRLIDHLPARTGHPVSRNRPRPRRTPAAWWLASAATLAMAAAMDYHPGAGAVLAAAAVLSTLRLVTR